MIDAGRLRSSLLRGALLVSCAIAWLWGAGAIAFAPYAAAPVRAVLAGMFLLAFPFARRAAMRRWPPLAATGVLLAAAVTPLLLVFVLARPSNDRAWNADQDRLPRARVDGDRVALSNVRNFAYRSAADFVPRWEDRDYALSRLETLWFVVEPFSGFPGAAHTFLSFGFDDGRYLAVSAEIRKERGESFSPWKGMFRNYELMYVFGDERDLVHLRTEHRKDTVYVYPVRASKDVVRSIFLDVLARANALAAQPEFYHSVTNTCTTNIVDHANRLQPGLVPLSWRILLPGHSDAQALELGLIDFDGSLEDARARFRVNERAAGTPAPADLSARIRRAN